MLAPALRATPLIDADHPAIVALAQSVTARCGSDPVSRAVALYEVARDQFRYDPYRVNLSEAGMRASQVITQGHGWCVTKAALLAALCRASGIAARVGYADVRNHLSTERLRAVIDGQDYIWHGYTSICLDGVWRKATPAFDQGLCAKLGLEPLAFNGRSDSLFQAEDAQGRRRLEYLRERGEFDDVPLDRIRADFVQHYPALVAMASADFDQDLRREAVRSEPLNPSSRPAR